jgi:hypothetical protein
MTRQVRDVISEQSTAIGTVSVHDQDLAGTVFFKSRTYEGVILITLDGFNLSMEFSPATKTSEANGFRYTELIAVFVTKIRCFHWKCSYSRLSL